jgi:hypothetical protein
MIAPGLPDLCYPDPNMNLVLVNKDSVRRIYSCWPVKAGFSISRDPVTAGEYEDVMALHQQHLL